VEALGLSSRFNVINKLRVCRYRDVMVVFFGGEGKIKLPHTAQRKCIKTSSKLCFNFARESSIIITQDFKQKKDNL